jgi:hypothetical protein
MPRSPQKSCRALKVTRYSSLGEHREPTNRHKQIIHGPKGEQSVAGCCEQKVVGLTA